MNKPENFPVIRTTDQLPLSDLRKAIEQANQTINSTANTFGENIDQILSYLNYLQDKDYEEFVRSETEPEEVEQDKLPISPTLDEAFETHIDSTPEFMSLPSHPELVEYLISKDKTSSSYKSPWIF